jgi:lipopolysaccharide export system permease protein
MTRLSRYVTLELLPPLLAGALLFTAILSFGYFFISSQWLTGVPLGLVARWIGYQMPDTLVKVSGSRRQWSRPSASGCRCGWLRVPT